MSDAPEPEFAPRPPVDDWLLPMDVGVGEDHSPWGPDLEYDPDMQALEQAAAGKPETQFAPAEPPDWNAVHEMAAALMRRTRDLRIAMHWCRAHVNLEGFEGVPPALCLLQGMLDNLWDGLHPMPDPDDGDTFARLSAIGGLDKLDGLLGDVRNALVTRDRRLAGLRVRGVEIATDRLPARPDEVGMSRAQIETALAELPEVAQALRAQCAEAQHWARRLSSVMNDRFGIGESVDLKRLRGMLTAIESVLPAVVEEVSTDEAIVDVEADLGDEGAPPAAATEPRGAKAGAEVHRPQPGAAGADRVRRRALRRREEGAAALRDGRDGGPVGQARGPAAAGGRPQVPRDRRRQLRHRMKAMKPRVAFRCPTR
jgi:type VI secretion system protein ImpA